MSYVVEPHGSYFIDGGAPPPGLQSDAQSGTSNSSGNGAAAEGPRRKHKKKGRKVGEAAVAGKPARQARKRKKKKKKKALSKKQLQAIERYHYDAWVLEQHKLFQQDSPSEQTPPLSNPQRRGNTNKESPPLSRPVNKNAALKPVPPTSKRPPSPVNIGKGRKRRLAGTGADLPAQKENAAEAAKSPVRSKSTSPKESSQKGSAHRHATRPNIPRPKSTQSFKPRGIPFSRAKQNAMEQLANEVTTLKNKYNLIKLKADVAERELAKRQARYKEDLEIKFQGIQFDNLEFKDALSPKRVVAKKLHQVVADRLGHFLYDFFQASPPITKIDELVEDIVGDPQNGISEELQALLFSGATMDDILCRKKKEAVEFLIDEAKLWEQQLKFVIERERVFSARVGGQIEDFNHHITKIKEDVKICKTNLVDFRSQHDNWKNDLAELEKKLTKQRKQNTAEIESLKREEQDSAKWTAEVEQMSSRRKRVTKMFNDDLIAKKMAREAREQDMKRALLQAKKEQEERRLKPFREAATKIYNLTGVKDIDLILETFETWEGKQENMKEMIDQKEGQIENYQDEISRLTRLLNQSKVIGKPSGDQKRLGTDVYTSKLTEALAEANMGRMRARTKFVTKRDALIGLATAAKKMSLEVQLPKLKEEELVKFVMPKKSRRRSIASRPTQKLSTYDKARGIEEIQYARDLTEKVRQGIQPILDEILPKLREIAKARESAQKGKPVDTLEEMSRERERTLDANRNLMGANVDSKSTSSIDSKRSKGRRGSKVGSKAPSRASSSASLAQRSTKSEEKAAEGEGGYTAQDFAILNEEIHELSPSKNAENMRISARKVIVSEYFDYGQGKVQYYYEYISEDEDDQEEGTDDKRGGGAASELPSHSHKAGHKRTEGTDWEKHRKESKERAISIADIYRKQTATSTDMDPTRYLLNDSSSHFSAENRIDQEFKNLHTDADYTRHALDYEDDVLNMSKAARRQTSAWRKKQNARKKEMDMLDASKHHHNTIRGRDF